MKPNNSKPATVTYPAWKPKPTVPADWASADAEVVLDVVAAIGAVGGAIRLGYTRDGGAYAIGLYGLEPAPTTIYIRPDEPLNEILSRLAVDIRNR